MPLILNRRHIEINVSKRSVYEPQRCINRELGLIFRRRQQQQQHNNGNLMSQNDMYQHENYL